MSRQGFLRQHRAWEDWAVLALGLAIALAPWATMETTNQPVVLNAAVAGFAMMMLAELDLVNFRRWVVLGQLACAGWIALSPSIFGYAAHGWLRFWHVSAGLLGVLLSGLELWQYRLGAHSRSEGNRDAAGPLNVDDRT